MSFVSSVVRYLFISSVSASFSWVRSFVLSFWLSFFSLVFRYGVRLLVISRCRYLVRPFFSLCGSYFFSPSFIPYVSSFVLSLARSFFIGVGFIRELFPSFVLSLFRSSVISFVSAVALSLVRYTCIVSFPLSVCLYCYVVRSPFMYFVRPFFRSGRPLHVCRSSFLVMSVGMSFFLYVCVSSVCMSFFM